MTKILIVDDEEHIRELLRFNLEKAGYEVKLAEDGVIGLEMIDKERPDLLILDLMLPKMDGMSICRQLRSMVDYQDLPIIMLTAKGEEIDKVLGLELGADDYITKPFSPRELLARVHARLRRNKISESEGERLVFGELCIEPQRFLVTVQGDKIETTPKEFELLKVLASNPGKVFSRDELLERIWGYEYCGDTRTVDVHIRHLRQKIEPDPSNPRYIETLRGIGYRFKDR